MAWYMEREDWGQGKGVPDKGEKNGVGGRGEQGDRKVHPEPDTPVSCLAEPEWLAGRKDGGDDSGEAENSEVCTSVSYIERKRQRRR